MLFFVNEQGTTVNMVNEPVNVGSTNANEVILVAPISQANQVTIAFRLPNGATVSERIMSLLEQQLVINNKTYSVYRYLMDGTITAVSGICKVQFKIYQYQFTNDDSVRNAVLATYTSNFVIREGIFATFPETPTSTIYQQILTYLATLNPNYLVQSVDYVNENSLIEPETWISGVHNKIVCYDPTSLNAYGVTSACELSLANLFGGQNKPLFICNTEMADVYTDDDATNIGTGAKIENISTNLHTGKIQVNISNCKYDTVIKVAHLENSSWVADGTFVVRAANGSNVNIICGIQKTNVTAFAVFQDYNATRELDESKGDDYLPPKTAHDNDPSITEFQGFTKERYQINSVYTWAYTQDGDVWDMVGGTLQLKMLNGNIWSFPDFDYNATKLACKEYKDLAHKWANYSDDSDTPSVTNNAYYYSEIAHGWANNYQVGTPSATNNAMYFAGQAATSAVNASNSETAANNSKLAAQTAEANAHAWATGDSTDGTSPSSTNNAKYFADNAHDDADSAETDALKSEGYAVGTQNGVEAQEEEPYYHDNAKWYNEDLKSQKFAKDLTADLNSTTYVVTLKLYSSTTHIDSGGDSTLLATQTFDLPIESAIVNIQYVDTEEHPTSLLFTLQSGATTYVPIGSIISGLATETYVNGEIDKIKNGTYAVGILDGAIVAQGNTYPVSGLVDVINSTLYWKHASHAVDASNLLVSGVAKSGATIQGEIDAKIPKANIDTSMPATPLDTHVPSTKLFNDTVEGVKTALENGTLVPAKSLTTKQVENLSEDSGSTQTDPFVFQATGTNNNTTLTPTAPVAKQLELRANSVAVNQLVQNGTFANGMSNWTLAVGTSSVSNNVCEITSNGGNTYIYQGISQKVQGHKIIVFFTLYSSVNRTLILNWGDTLASVSITTAKKTFSILATVGGGNNNLNFTFPNATSGEKEYLSNVYLIDLTQWFGSDDNIPSDLLAHPETWYNYDNTDGSYNTGTIVDSNADELECIEKNQWDEQLESGEYNEQGQKQANANFLRNTNKIRIIPNTTYYLKSPLAITLYYFDCNENIVSIVGTQNKNTTFTTPSNACFMCFAFNKNTYGSSTYKNDISIYIVYWKNPNDHSQGMDGDHYTTYTPYVKHTYALTPLDKPYSVSPSVYNYRSANGLETDVVDKHTFTGNETIFDFQFDGNNDYIIFDIADVLNNSTVGGVALPNNAINVTKMYCGSTSSKHYLAVQFKLGAYSTKEQALADLTGKFVYFPLATPTTSQGDAFAENVIVDDYGTMAFKKNGSYVTTPQGNRFFYPADYVLLMDDFNNYVEGDATALAKNESITDAALNARGYYKMQDLSSSCISSNDSNLTFSITKAVKMNGLVNLTLRANNGTGASISAGAVLFTLSNDIHRSEQIKVIGVVDTTSQVFNISSAGQVTCNGAIASGDTLHLYVSFIVST